MKFFDWLLGNPWRAKLDDPAFGHIEFHFDSPKGESGAWYGMWKHPDVDDRLEVEIYADITGPSDDQRRIFNDAKENLTQIENQMGVTRIPRCYHG